MRFTLAFVSSALLATVAMAAPTAPSNAGDNKVSTTTTVSPLDYGLNFQTFNWESKNGKTHVDRSFTLDLTEPASFQITDYKLGGDMYEVSDNGKVIGMTNAANGTASAFAETPEEAVADKRFSRGEFNLAKGHHDITITVHNSPYSVGSGAVRIVKKLQALYGKDHDDDDDDDDHHHKHDDDDDDDDDHHHKHDDDDDDDDDHHHKHDDDDDDDDWEDHDDYDDDDWKHDYYHKRKGGRKHYNKKKVVYVYKTIPCECPQEPPPPPAPEPLVDPEEKFVRELRPIDPTTSYSRKETLHELMIDIFSDIHSHRRNIKSKHRSVFDNVVSVMTSGHDDLRSAIHSDMRDLLSDKVSKINARIPVLRMAKA